jgi:hypothetical protein
VNHIIVIGHSLTDIDQRYFGEIRWKAPSAHWYISIHNDKDKERLKNFKKRMYRVSDDKWHVYSL